MRKNENMKGTNCCKRLVTSCFWGGVIIAICGLCLSCSSNYLYRVAVWNFSDVNDYTRFPSRPLENQPPAFHFREQPQHEAVAEIFRALRVTSHGKPRPITDFETFLEETDTTAFLVIVDDALWYEGYFNGSRRDSINTSFSVAKSFASALIGIAIDDGKIQSVDEPITNYLPELKSKGFESVTIKHLLMMASGIAYKGGGLIDDNTKTYYRPDLRKLALQETRISGASGERFLYNNYHPLLLGLILERATQTPVTEYLQEKIWKRIGMEFPGSWSIDSERSGFAKMESGINARAIDFAKFGRLFLREGNWEGQQILSREWVRESTRQAAVPNRDDYYRLHRDWPMFQLRDGGGYYTYMWWGIQRDAANYDFLAIGHLGQFIYVCPSQRLTIVRNGLNYGDIDSWEQLFFDFATQIGASLKKRHV